MTDRKLFVSDIFVGRMTKGRKEACNDWSIVREEFESNTFQRVYPTVNQP